MNEIYLAGGSFWSLQKYFNIIFGVLKTEVGYANGKTKETSYNQLSTTNHAETVHIIYNKNIISLPELLKYYYAAIDPTSFNKQGKDSGSQYRLGIYYTDKKELPTIIESLEELQKGIEGNVAIETEKIKNFIRAEEYHQNFLLNNPFAYSHISFSQFENLKIKQMENISYRVMKLHETEPAFKNEYFANFKDGIYIDKETGEVLFSSKDKYNAKTGFPTFSKPINENAVIKHINIKKLKIVVEIVSKEGKNHLGYLYYDGPKKLGGLRYSVNSAALEFIPKNKMKKRGYEEYLSLI
ncbi:MAG: peptide-methionine (S)-S-oxide reductase MsrA [Bacilli bacterium]|nr:peptide-methionine (S)-S-oxide reductase MsrA [Bacilli bacterium]